MSVGIILVYLTKCMSSFKFEDSINTKQYRIHSKCSTSKSYALITLAKVAIHISMTIAEPDN